MSQFTRIVLLALSLGSWAFGQRDLGTVLGTITDAQGSVVPGAKVTITEDATGLQYALEANSNGEYIRTALKAGVYSIEAEATGFKKTVQHGITLTAGDRSAVNLSLTVGEVNQSVEITTAAPVLQTESTIIGQTVNSKNVSELPLGGQRKFTYLARLSAGVLPAEQGARDAAGGGFSANGVRSNGQNNFLLNGVDNNVNVIDFINQTSYVIGPSVEAIGEMRVLTNGYNAEYGRGAGGVVNVTIKSGTNQIHGTLFEFLQNDKLDANQWESNKAGKSRGPFKQNQYGAAVGGPAIKNRTFWFADFQGTNIRSTGGAVAGLGSTFVGTIPTVAFRNGDYSSLLGNVIGTDSLGRQVRQGQLYDIQTTRTVNGILVRDPFLGNIIPSNRFDPVAKKLMDLYPAPNQNLTNRIPANNYFNVVSGSDNTYQGDVRIDHKVSDKDSIFGSLSWSEERKFNGTPLPAVLDAGGFAGQNETDLSRNAMISYTRVWTPSLLTETRAAFSRLVTERVQANAGVDLFKQFGIGGYNPTTTLNGGLPQTGMQDYTTIGAGNWLPTKEFNNVWDFVQNVSINKGKHALKFGAEYRPIKFPFFQVPSPHGQLDFQRDRNNNPESAFQAQTGDGSAAFLLGYPSTGQISTTNFISSEKQAWGFYAQDDWKVTSKLTLNIGMRYELFSPISERFGQQSNFDIQTMTLYIPKGKNQDLPLPPNFATTYPNVKVSRGQVDKYLIPWDKTDWSPRIGLAYAVLPKTVVRAGYGIFYGGEENQGGSA
ncbi:MAG: TonB-dependent receptor, partial [Bryobacteraceae bacterium]